MVLISSSETGAPVPPGSPSPIARAGLPPRRPGARPDWRGWFRRPAPRPASSPRWASPSRCRTPAGRGAAPGRGRRRGRQGRGRGLRERELAPGARDGVDRLDRGAGGVRGGAGGAGAALGRRNSTSIGRGRARGLAAARSIAKASPAWRTIGDRRRDVVDSTRHRGRPLRGSFGAEGEPVHAQALDDVDQVHDVAVVDAPCRR